VVTRGDHSYLDKWDWRFIDLAKTVSSWSKDPRRKVGCVLVKGKREVSMGYNGFPEDLSDSLERLTNPSFKDRVIIHAEWNAVINAAKFGVPVEGTSAYITYHPCSRCASVLIQAGVKRVVCPPPSYASEKWKEDFQTSSDILVEADIPVYFYNPEE
jgi:dCMP deaminase